MALLQQVWGATCLVDKFNSVFRLAVCLLFTLPTEIRV